MKTSFCLMYMLAACAAPPARTASPAAPPAHRASPPEVAQIVDEIRRADYRGDLDALERGYQALAPHDASPAVRYWRGFARWRQGMNRANVDGFDRALATREFRDGEAAFRSVSDGALAADARSSQAGCIAGVAFVMERGAPEQRALFGEMARLIDEAATAEPDNPRVLWMLGGKHMWTPEERGGGRAKALEAFERGLALARKAPPPTDPLAPAWGEPELLMSLAFVHSSFPPQDLARAERYARDALALQPDWHFVRDILLPKIVKGGG